MNKKKSYKIGNHRGNGRIFLEGELIRSSGFNCGVPYTRVDNLEGGEISLFSGRGSRRVTQATRKGKSRPIIDLSDSTILDRFAGCSRVEVEFGNGLLIIRGVNNATQ